MLQWQFPRGTPQGRSHRGEAPRTDRPGSGGAAGAGPGEPILGEPCWGRGTPWQACRGNWQEEGQGKGQGRGHWAGEGAGESRGKDKGLCSRALSDYMQYGPKKDQCGQIFLGRRQKPPAGARIISRPYLLVILKVYFFSW